jgi:hypothetical protein
VDQLITAIIAVAVSLCSLALVYIESYKKKLTDKDDNLKDELVDVILSSARVPKFEVGFETFSRAMDFLEGKSDDPGAAQALFVRLLVDLTDEQWPVIISELQKAVYHSSSDFVRANSRFVRAVIRNLAEPSNQ